MEFRNLLADDDAVSPVIGVILMVAITVILAAVIGTFVLGLGDQVQQTSPTAQFSFEYGASDGNNNQGLLEVTHDGGDGVESDQISIIHSGGNSWGAGDSTTGSNAFFAGTGETVTAGDSAELHDGDDANSTTVDLSQDVSVVWNAEDGDRSSTLAEWEA